MQIRSIDDLQKLILTGETDWKQYGEVNAAYYDGLVLFNYTPVAQFAGRWNWFEQNARGLIFNAQTGECLARPFYKFFNYGERLPMPETFLVEATEKVDGSLGILYRWKGEYRVATRGSFTSDQALWATEWLQQQYDLTGLPENLTLLFEIVYPANRVVVDYMGLHDLILIGARDIQTGVLYYYEQLVALAEQFDFSLPRAYRFESPEEALRKAEMLPVTEEGYVLRFSDNELFKVKGEAYKVAHRVLTGASFNRVLDAVAQGAFESLIEGVPDEFLGQVKAWKAEIEAEVQRIEERCVVELTWAPQESQKEFALWVQQRFDKEFQSYLFAARARKDLKPIIYRRAFVNRMDAHKPSVIDDV